MNDIWDKLKEKYGTYKTEALLMLLFVVGGVFLVWPEVSSQISPVSGTNVQIDQDGEDKSESGQTAGDLGETESEGMETESEPDSESFSESASESSQEQDGAGAQAELAQADRRRYAHRLLASLPEGFRYPMVWPETEATDGTETAFSETEISGGAETEDLDRISGLRTLRDTRELYGYHPVHPQELFETEQYEELMEGGMVRSLALLQTMLRTRLEAYDGDWSIYVKNLSTDESFVINDRPMKSASVMKLFIMGTVYKAFESGELARTDETMALMDSMITASDNEASNQLLYLLGDSSYEAGIDMVNEFVGEYGFSDMTIEYNGFNNSATVMDSGHSNQVAAKDCGKLLEDIYRREWVNRSVSNEIEGMLLNQGTRYKIPAGLPDGVLCGNKTGEMETTENDAAIIYGEECDYILVVLSSDWNSKDEAISRIASISQTVYSFLN